MTTHYKGHKLQVTITENNGKFAVKATSDCSIQFDIVFLEEYKKAMEQHFFSSFEEAKAEADKLSIIFCTTRDSFFEIA